MPESFGRVFPSADNDDQEIVDATMGCWVVLGRLASHSGTRSDLLC